MPFCPKCRYEYRPGIEYCPDCEERLVDTPPDQKNESDSHSDEDIKNWVPLARLTAQPYAETVVEGLRHKCIPVVMLSESGHFGITGQLSIGMYRPVGGGYLILVPPECAEDADYEAELMLGEEWSALGKASYFQKFRTASMRQKRIFNLIEYYLSLAEFFLFRGILWPFVEH